MLGARHFQHFERLAAAVMLGEQIDQPQRWLEGLRESGKGASQLGRRATDSAGALLDPGHQQNGIEVLGQAIGQGAGHGRGLAEAVLSRQRPHHQCRGPRVVGAHGRGPFEPARRGREIRLKHRHPAELAIGLDRVGMDLGEVAEHRLGLGQPCRVLEQPPDRDPRAQMPGLEAQHPVPMAERALDVTFLLGGACERLAPAGLTGLDGRQPVEDGGSRSEPMLGHEHLGQLLQRLGRAPRHRQHAVIAPSGLRIVLALSGDARGFQRQLPRARPTPHAVGGQRIRIDQPQPQPQDAQQAVQGGQIVWRRVQDCPPLRFGLAVAALRLQQARQLRRGRRRRVAGRARAAKDRLRLVGAALARHALGQAQGRRTHAAALGGRATRLSGRGHGTRRLATPASGRARPAGELSR